MADEPAATDQPVPIAEEPRLTDLLGIRLGLGANEECLWTFGVIPGSSDALSRAAELLAHSHMRMHCGNSPAYSLWSSRVNLIGPNPDDTDRMRIEPFIQDAFGLPTRPRPANHVEGYVAQLIWHRVVSEATLSPDGTRTLVHVEDVGFSVLEPGGDGLAVYSSADHALVFRLWEIKKHATTRHVSATIARACDQLNESATRYLAKFTSAGKGYEGELGRLYAELVDLWVEANQRAGAGVAVAASESHAPRRRAFGSLPTRLPRLVSLGRREGLLTAVGDFAQFAEMTRDWVWSGL